MSKHIKRWQVFRRLARELIFDYFKVISTSCALAAEFNSAHKLSNCKNEVSKEPPDLVLVFSCFKSKREAEPKGKNPTSRFA